MIFFDLSKIFFEGYGITFGNGFGGMVYRFGCIKRVVCEGWMDLFL